MNKHVFIVLLCLYLITALGLVIYTYSQIDLNLTLFSFPSYQNVQKQLILLGYFNRPLSTLLFLLIISMAFLLYAFILKLCASGKIKSKYLYAAIIAVSVFSVFSYPAFSHDIFNYMFDARIVTKYGQNPYLFKAQDFPDDLWTRFMHWTHRTYPYGPLWIFLTLPFSYLGFEKFVLTLFNFKVMFLIFHLGNVYLIGKITKSVAATAFYAFNPLVIIESVVSPHNESVMLFFLLAAFYFRQIKNTLLFLITLIASGLVKYVTFILMPLFVLSSVVKKIQQKVLYQTVFILLLIAVFYLSTQRETYPWYFVTMIGVGSLIPSNSTKLMLVFLSFGLLLRYAPYLYAGSYPPWVGQMQNQLLVIPVLFSAVLIILYRSKLLVRGDTGRSSRL